MKRVIVFGATGNLGAYIAMHLNAEVIEDIHSGLATVLQLPLSIAIDIITPASDGTTAY